MLALLPSAAKKILETLDVEQISLEIQQLKGTNGPVQSIKNESADSMSLPETTGLTDEDGRSMISASESGVHASQVTLPPASQPSETGKQAQPEKPKRTKRQLWGDITISCKRPLRKYGRQDAEGRKLTRHYAQPSREHSPSYTLSPS